MQMQYALILGAVSIHYCSFLHSGHATSFLRLYRISSHLHTPTSSSASFHCASYQSYNTFTQRQLHCACCFKPMTKGHQPDLQVVPHDKRFLVTALAIFAYLAPPPAHCSRCNLCHLCLAGTPPHFFFYHNPPSMTSSQKGPDGYLSGENCEALLIMS